MRLRLVPGACVCAAMLLAGCASEPTNGLNDAPAPDPEPALRTMPLAWDGQLAYGGCVPTRVIGCYYAMHERPYGWKGQYLDLPPMDKAVALVGNLTWEASSPVSQTMQFWIECPNHPRAPCAGIPPGPAVTGPSPLAVSLALRGEPGPMHLFVEADHSYSQPPVTGTLGDGTLFRFEGGLVLQA